MKIKVHPHVADQLDGLRKKDFRLQFFRASGPGGQHRNKTSTATRITHIATGISAEATDSRSQSDNRAAAFRKLVAKLVEHYAGQFQTAARRTNAGWAEKIRTYHEPRDTVTDHRTGVTRGYKAVLAGDIDPFIDACYEKEVTMDIKTG